MTFIWFIIWLLCDLIDAPAPLHFAPVNAAAGLLLLCVACDLSAGRVTSS